MHHTFVDVQTREYFLTMQHTGFLIAQSVTTQLCHRHRQQKLTIIGFRFLFQALACSRLKQTVVVLSVKKELVSVNE